MVGIRVNCAEVRQIFFLNKIFKENMVAALAKNLDLSKKGQKDVLAITIGP
jgi:hypothetical protein